MEGEGGGWGLAFGFGIGLGWKLMVEPKEKGMANGVLKGKAATHLDFQDITDNNTKR